MAGRYGKEPITCGVRFVDTKMARDRRIVREVIDKRKRCEGLTHDA